MPMIEIDPSRFKVKPFAQQILGTKKIISNTNFALFDEMGVGKSKQVIDACCVLFENNMLDLVIVVCPAVVKFNWFDADLGQIAIHSWVPTQIEEYSGRRQFTNNDLLLGRRLQWIISSYDFLRQGQKKLDQPGVRLQCLLKYARKRKSMVVFDEAKSISSPTAKQTKMAARLRMECDRAVLLEGTPITRSPLDMYAPFAVLDKGILGYKNFYHFRSQHAIMGGWHNKKAVKFINVDYLQCRTKPYCLRRLKTDVMDLPDKLPAKVLEFPLSPKSWGIYKQMRDEMVAWLDRQPSLAKNGGVKAVRLAQITAGFLGGLEDPTTPEGEFDFDYQPNVVGSSCAKILEIGTEKQDGMLSWLEDQDIERLIIWCRFRAEMDRLAEAMAAQTWGVFKIQGGQSKGSRNEAIEEFQAGQRKRVVLLGQPAAGGFGLNLTTAHNVVYLSNTFSLRYRLQSEDRVHRPGQTNDCNYWDIVATGPAGQKTIDHQIIKALRANDDMAKWTTAAWRRAIMEE